MMTDGIINPELVWIRGWDPLLQELINVIIQPEGNGKEEQMKCISVSLRIIKNRKFQKIK